MDGYGQYCPIARGAEIFAARWTPIIVRNMLIGCRTFGEIREGAPGIPRALLSERLRQLEHYGIVVRSPNPAGRGYVYDLTEAGLELQSVCDALGAWGARWLELAPAHLDASIVLWSICRCLPTAEIPDPRMVVRFDLSDGTPQRFWIVAQRPRPEVCVKPPGFDEDLVVRTDSASLAKWQMGWVSLGTAQRYRLIEVAGPLHLQRRLASWAGRHRFADIKPPRGAGVAASRGAGVAASRGAGVAASRGAGVAASREAGATPSRAAGIAASREAGATPPRGAGATAPRELAAPT